jgi:hypothetical protein
MAGVVPIVPPRTGTMGGKLQVETERFVTVDELYYHVIDFKNFIDELDKKGLKYLLIDCHGKVVMEIAIEAAPYIWQSYEAPRGGFAYKLDFDFGRRLPRMGLKSVISLENCIINIRTKDFARAITIDLVKKSVTYVHDSLWVLQGQDCARESQEVLKVLHWLVKNKRFTLEVSGGESHYRKLVALMGGK